jgi:2',3'-cyclic-nucleotide 2'-phosphodiesterase (5'-nucleotidase family)
MRSLSRRTFLALLCGSLILLGLGPSTDAAAQSPHTVFVLAGDFLSPSTLSSIFQGSQMVAALNAIGLDLVTFGNHEFDFGPAITRERMGESPFTWVSSNILDPESGPPFGGAAPFVLREYAGIRVAP